MYQNCCYRNHFRIIFGIISNFFITGFGQLSLGQLLPSSLDSSPEKNSVELFNNRLGRAQAFALLSKIPSLCLGSFYL